MLDKYIKRKEQTICIYLNKKYLYTINNVNIDKSLNG